MDKRQCAVTVIVGIAMFGAGFLARMVWDRQEKEQNDLAIAALEQELAEAKQEREITPQILEQGGYLPAEALRVRVDDGRVQWYDGQIWHDVAAVEELEKEDRFYLAGENFAAFDEQLRQESVAKRQEEAVALSENEDIVVGQKEVPKPTARPKPAVTPQQPATTPEPEPEPEVAPPASSGGGGGGGGGGSVAPPPAADPPQDSGGSSGGSDGEDSEWTDDYL